MESPLLLQVIDFQSVIFCDKLASIMKLTLIIILNLLSLNAFAGSTIFCSHAELCKMLNRIALENKITDLKTNTLVSISGDPHEYEPSISEIKKLISAPILLTGPNELNPWIKKINFQRSKSLATKTIGLTLDGSYNQFYPHASAETLAHFWLYPKVYCSLKSKLETELIKLGHKLTAIKKCEADTAEKLLSDALAKLNRPVILTHDALLPLMNSLGSNKAHLIIAIKGSSHHEESAPLAVKKMYDALKAPRVIWVQEIGIHVPANVLNKIRSSDTLIKIDSAKSLDDNPFSVLVELANRLNQSVEK